jgi:hypothetical protein
VARRPDCLELRADGSRLRLLGAGTTSIDGLRDVLVGVTHQPSHVEVAHVRSFALFSFVASRNRETTVSVQPCHAVSLSPH